MGNLSLSRLLHDRRIQIGLKLDDVAQALGVSKSYMSRVEASKRTPTEAQVTRLATILALPPDLVRIVCGRLPPDVMSADGVKALAVTMAYRQSESAHAMTVAEKPEDSIGDLLSQSAIRPYRDVTTPFQGDIRAGKNTTSYRTHSYHTKVPPEAIVPILEHYTQPGDLVLDPFCGSGMTGVAAIETGRNAILSDLSPAAVHISKNYTTPCSSVALRQAFERVADAVRPTMAWLYEVPLGASPRPVIEYTVWSDVFECPTCHQSLVYWLAARHPTKGDVEPTVKCAACGGAYDKRELRWIGETPVETNVSNPDGSRSARPPSDAELELIAHVGRVPIPYWLPDVPFDDQREMWRAAHRAAGINSAAAFYTTRNLHALAAVRHAILTYTDGRVREALMFAFTACVNRASKRYQWNAKRPTNVMTGTLYVSSLRYEWNVFSLFRRKVKDAIRYYERLGAPRGRCAVVPSSATDLTFVPDRSIDFVFMDPPFGSNIFYADSSLLWEAWLGRLTDQQREMVVSKKRSRANGGKTLDDYGDMMARAFTEVRRVLKRDAQAALVFNNTDGRVWSTLQRALAEAGLTVAATSSLHKIHPSIKGVKGVQGKENVSSFDSVMSLRVAKTTVAVPAIPTNTDLTAVVQDLVRESISARIPDEIRLDEVHSAVVRGLIDRNLSVAGLSIDTVRLAYERVVEPALTQREQTRSAELGPSLLKAYTREAPARVVASGSAKAKRVSSATVDDVAGKRNSALYNAHSYHTKVPPEAIIPFIEHFTRRGDVVLDPFAGSGMTGVAAALVGRQSILSDLSVVASHLSFNHTHPCDPDHLRSVFSELYDRISPDFQNIYRTEEGAEVGYVHYTMWSAVLACPVCREHFLMWDAIDQREGRVGTTLSCIRCGTPSPRRHFRRVGNSPAWLSFSVLNSGTKSRHGRRPTPEDLRFIETFKRDTIRDWYPTDRVDPNREMYIRCALQLQGISGVADFYTPRNLGALARLWAEIARIPDPRIRQVVAFGFTNTAWHGTRMRRFNARGGQRPLTGTLYIPQLSVEVNVLEVLAHKIEQLVSYYTAYKPGGAVPSPIIRTGSATRLDGIADESIDYIFTDPPFGSNIFYADCNLIWDAWLGQLTDVENEAVVNRSRTKDQGGKSVEDYQALMTASLLEMRRVLKPGGWVTLVFHNTDPKVWGALQTAAAEAGFHIEQAASLNRQQHSHKGYKGRAGIENVAHFDVIVSMRRARTRVKRPPASDSLLFDVVRDTQRALREDFTIQRAHAAVLRRLANDGFDLGSITFDRVRVISEQTCRM